MTKIRRGNDVFLAWVGDHGPKHVHVYRDGGFVVKFDLDNWTPMRGQVTRRLERILRQLRHEGLL